MPKSPIVHYRKDDGLIPCNSRLTNVPARCYTNEALRVNCKSCRKIIETGSVQLVLKFKKSYLVKRMAKKLGVPCIDIKLSSCPVGDLKGLPFKPIVTCINEEGI
jgi:hypothetical protein